MMILIQSRKKRRGDSPEPVLVLVNMSFLSFIVMNSLRALAVLTKGSAQPSLLLSGILTRSCRVTYSCSITVITRLDGIVM